MPEENRVLGRGKIYFRRSDDTTGAYRYLGNTPSLSITIDRETLDHYSSESGVREKDASVTTEVNYSGTMVCDNINVDNLALLFFGTTAPVSQAAATAQQEELTVKQGYTYFLPKKKVSNVTVTGAAGTPTYKLTDDYTLDLVTGDITIVEGGAISSGAAIEVNYDCAAISYDRVISGTEPVQGSLYFKADNALGDNVDYTLASVNLSPNGEFSLKGDDWQQIPFSMEILKPVGGVAIEAHGRPVTA